MNGKISFLILIIGLVLISGCSEKTKSTELEGVVVKEINEEATYPEVPVEKPVKEIEDPCRDIGMDEYALVGDVGLPAKSLCYINKASETLDFRICEFLANESFEPHLRGNCILNIAVDTLDIKRCDMINLNNTVERCRTYINNRIKYRCESLYGVARERCEEALPKIGNMSGILNENFE